MCQAYINGDVFVEFDDVAETCLPEPKGPLEKLNQLAWAHQVVKKDGTVFRQINDLDCIVIAMKRAEMAKNPKKSDGIVHLIEMDLDLKTNKVTLMHGPPNLELTLVMEPNNDRTRGKGQRKADGSTFLYKDKFNNDLCKFGYAWHEKNKKKNPSLNQIVKGL